MFVEISGLSLFYWGLSAKWSRWNKKIKNLGNFKTYSGFLRFFDVVLQSY